LGDFRRGVQVICSVKLADDLVLLDKEGRKEGRKAVAEGYW
jgi:hypothetical protein